MSDRPSGILIFTVVLCGAITLITISKIIDIYRAKKVIKKYLERMEWVQNKWGFQMPFTYPKLGPDPRGPVRRVGGPTVSI